MIITAESKEMESTSYGIPIRNIWYMLIYYLKSRDKLRNRWRSEVESAPNIDCLLASILTKQIQQRIRIGLGRDYNEIENEIYGIRGRIDFDKSIKFLCFPQGRTFSRYYLYMKNVFKNQIIRSTLSRMIQVGDFGSDKIKAKDQRNNLRSIIQEMDGIDLIDLKPTDIRRELLLQRDMDYRLMLTLCYLLYSRLMPVEKRGKDYLLKVNRDELTLYDIYEKFVAEFYKYHLKDWNVNPQSIINWPTTEETAFLPIMKPDIIFEHKESRKIIILDTKFTKESIVEGRWDNLTFNTKHLYQIYSYLKTQEHKSEYYRKSTGILLYPTATYNLSEEIEIQGHRIRWESINLAQPWQEIKKDLLALINDF